MLSTPRNAWTNHDTICCELSTLYFITVWFISCVISDDVAYDCVHLACKKSGQTKYVAQRNTHVKPTTSLHRFVLLWNNDTGRGSTTVQSTKHGCDFEHRVQKPNVGSWHCESFAQSTDTLVRPDPLGKCPYSWQRAAWAPPAPSPTGIAPYCAYYQGRSALMCARVLQNACTDRPMYKCCDVGHVQSDLHALRLAKRLPIRGGDASARVATQVWDSIDCASREQTVALAPARLNCSV